jgi:hypothetical protein
MSNAEPTARPAPRAAPVPWARRTAWRALTTLLVLVWGANGLWAKVLGQVPRHEAIVAAFVGETAARVFVVLIGLSELVMVAWILSRRFPLLCAAAQVAVVMTMNVREQTAAPELLLFGRYNLLWATLFSALVVAWHRLRPKQDHDRGSA